MGKEIVIDFGRLVESARQAGLEVRFSNIKAPQGTALPLDTLTLGIKVGFLYAIEEVVAKLEGMSNPDWKG